MTLSADRVKAIVSGGASGLGYATAARVVAQGGRVALLDCEQAQGEQAARSLGDRASYVHCDVTLEDSVQQALVTAVEQLQGINLAVNCAGVTSGQRVVGRDALLPLATFKRVVDVNLVGTFQVCRAAAAAMQHNPTADEEGSRGVIVNTASAAAFEGQVGQVPYAASKGAVASMTLPLAREFAAFGVRVVTIAPGIFATPMFERLAEPLRESLAADTPFPKRPGQPEEFAALVLHIYTNTMLNGTVIRLDGALRLPLRCGASS